MTITALSDRCVLVAGEALSTSRVLVRSKSIGLVLTDPPYGAHTHENLGRERRDDGVAPRAELEFPPLSRAFVGDLAAEFVRVVDGWILVFTDDRTVSWWGESIEAAGGRWVRTGQWVKTNPMPQMTGDRPAQGVEHIVIGHSYSPGTGRMAWAGGGRAAVWRGPRDLTALHPNQKPAWLMQELAGLFAPAGSTVFDPFMGSGSTGVGAFAAERLPGLSPLEPGCKGCGKKHAESKRSPLPSGLSFLGIELHAATLQVAHDRLSKELTQCPIAATPS